jgi:hypothetical protein
MSIKSVSKCFVSFPRSKVCYTQLIYSTYSNHASSSINPGPSWHDIRCHQLDEAVVNMDGILVLVKRSKYQQSLVSTRYEYY